MELLTRYAREERRLLAELLMRTGPDAPTLCEGWRTADLAAHLYIRERRLDAAPGILFPIFSGYTRRVQRECLERLGWAGLVSAVRSGPPLPLRFAPVDEQLNTAEYLVHHEDVRRAQPGWEPRELEPGLEDVLWARLRLMAVLARRSAPGPLALETPGRGRVTVRGGGRPVIVTGQPSELLLVVFGRQPAVRVEMAGDPDAVEAVRRAKFRF